MISLAPPLPRITDLMRAALTLLVLLGAAAQAIGLERGDAEFLREAAAAGRLEVSAGRIARQKGTDARIRAFSEMMVKDYAAILQDLRALAERKNLALADGGLDTDGIERIGALKAASTGEAFDDAYAELVEASHDETLKLYADAAKNASDLEVRSFATTVLPTIERHRALAEELEERSLMP